MSELRELDITWHFIGAIQSNKTRPLANSFDWVHCVDRFKIAKRLSEQRPARLGPLNICVQVNVDDEASKHGVALADVVELAAACAAQAQARPHVPARHARGLQRTARAVRDVAAAGGRPAA